jgi:hypothetical protein
MFQTVLVGNGVKLQRLLFRYGNYASARDWSLYGHVIAHQITRNYGIPWSCNEYECASTLYGHVITHEITRHYGISCAMKGFFFCRVSQDMLTYRNDRALLLKDLSC